MSGQSENENIPSRECFDRRGFVLEEHISLEELEGLEPKFFEDFIKFVIDKDTNKVAVGMEVHKSAEVFFGRNHGNLYGGNIYFDGSIIYTSTLNIAKNLEYWEKKHPAGLLKKKIPFQGNPRIITDEELIETIDATLFSWIEMEKNK